MRMLKGWKSSGGGIGKIFFSPYDRREKYSFRLLFLSLPFLFLPFRDSKETKQTQITRFQSDCNQLSLFLLFSLSVYFFLSLQKFFLSHSLESGCLVSKFFRTFSIMFWPHLFSRDFLPIPGFYLSRETFCHFFFLSLSHTHSFSFSLFIYSTLSLYHTFSRSSSVLLFFFSSSSFSHWYDQLTN